MTTDLVKRETDRVGRDIADEVDWRHPFRKALLVVMIAAQLLVPAWMIFARERVLADGEVYRFQTRPVDPYDAFRGRYVALDFEASSKAVPWADAAEAEDPPDRGTPVYVEIAKDAAGFASLVVLHRSPPEGPPYLKAKLLYRHSTEDGSLVVLPFDRYYLPEDAAPEAEALYRRGNRSGAREAWIDVRILDGRAVLEELYVDHKPILELVREELEAVEE